MPKDNVRIAIMSGEILAVIDDKAHSITGYHLFDRFDDVANAQLQRVIEKVLKKEFMK